jgi:hypothetical protein
MSLNRCEQRLFDYVGGQVDERHFWQNKVQKIVQGVPDVHAAATQIEGELWRYYVERSEVVPVFRAAVQLEGLQRTSMRNLAEFLLRLWTEPKPRKKSPGNST